MERSRKQVYLSPDQDEELSKLALATGRSESSIVGEALSEYLAKMRKEADASPNPLSKLLELKVETETVDGSEQAVVLQELQGESLPSGGNRKCL